MKPVTLLLTLGAILMLVGLIFSAPVQAQTISTKQEAVYSALTVNDIEPGAGQKWAVTDGYGIFAFYMTTDGNIQYQSGYPTAPGAPYNSAPVTFLNHKYTSFIQTTNPFSLTQGVFYAPSCPPGQNNPPQHQCIGSNFIFDAVWASGPSRISIIEVSDPLYTDENGLHYFIPEFVTNSTLGIYSVQTDGIPDRITAINLPDGDALVGDSELLANGTVQASVYHYFRGVNCATVPTTGCQLPTFSKVASWVGSSFYAVQPEYLAPYAYYVLGNNAIVNGNGTNTISIYRASSQESWIPNAPADRISVNQTLYASKFTIAADSSRLYVAGEYGLGVNANFFIFGTNGTAPSWRILTIPENSTGLNANEGGAYSAPHNDVFLSTHYGTLGVHFYFDYESAVASTSALANSTYLGVLYSHDQGVSWSEQNNLPLGPSCGVPGCYPPPTISGMARTPFNYNPEIDYMLLASKYSLVGQYYSSVDNLMVTLPSVVKVVAASTSTNFRFALNVNTVTQTGVVSSPIVGDLYTPAVMLFVVAVPAGVLGLGGKYMGGGKVGVTLMLLGTGVGLFAGLIYGLYPIWTLAIVILSLVAAVFYLRGGSATPSQEQAGGLT